MLPCTRRVAEFNPDDHDLLLLKICNGRLGVYIHSPLLNLPLANVQ